MQQSKTAKQLAKRSSASANNEQQSIVSIPTEAQFVQPPPMSATLTASQIAAINSLAHQNPQALASLTNPTSLLPPLATSLSLNTFNPLLSQTIPPGMFAIPQMQTPPSASTKNVPAFLNKLHG